jgi:hypothetical protein
MILALVVAGLALLAGWFLHSCQKSMAGHGTYHQCQMNREMLDMARYWYALDNGITSAPPLMTKALAFYVGDETSIACPGGGTYSISPTNQRVVCSLQEHMFDTCKGNHTPPDEPTKWSQEFPLDYRNSEQWWQSMTGIPDGTILRMPGATVLFRGLRDRGVGWGTMKVAGTGISTGISTGSHRNKNINGVTS